MSKKRDRSNKLGAVKLTDSQREVVAAGADSEFFKIIRDVVIPQRITQIALTNLSASTSKEELYFYKGMAHLARWIPQFLTGEAHAIDDAVYDNEEDGDGRNSAVDDHSV